MRIRGCVLLGLLVALAIPATASASTTIGTVTAPTGSTAGPACPASPDQVVLPVLSSAPAFQSEFTVPSGEPMDLTQWQVDATGGTPGAQITLAVLNADFQAEAPTISVVGVDSENLPATIPANGIVTFTPSTPILVSPGDAIAIYIGGATGIPCYFTGGSSIGSNDEVEGIPVSAAPTVGQNLQITSGTGVSQTTAVANLAATLVPLSYDAGVTAGAGPSNAEVGQPALLSATVTNHGPDVGPITFTDPVPAGLTVKYAGATSGGGCATSAVNIVTCTFPSMTVGENANVAIIVTPDAAKTYINSATVAVATGGSDPNSANNTATTSLTVGAAAPVIKCVVPKLGGATEKLTKSLLPLLSCKVGKIKTATSKSVPKGDVISTSPGAGSYAAGTSIGLTVSSGKPKPKKKKKKK